MLKCRKKVNPASAFLPVVNCLSLAVAFRNQSGTAGHVLVPSVLFFSINYKLFFFCLKVNQFPWQVQLSIQAGKLLFV
jgi:hypothetical protein